MSDTITFGLLLTLLAGGLLLAVVSNLLGERARIPAPALFLVGAAVLSDLFPSLAPHSIVSVQRVVTVALVVILFDGGMHIGRGRLRTNAGAIVWLGVAGTVVTAGALTVFSHVALGFEWRTSLLLATALAPTDPAVVFSVLGRREVSGRAGVLLEGESGANDPVGIALMVVLLGAGSTAGLGDVAQGVGEFALQMGVGGVVGVAGGLAMTWLMRRTLPAEGLYPIRVLAGAGLVFGLATLAHGSGFLAVFVAGIVLGDVRAPYKREIERFHSALASLGEIVAFAALGLTVKVSGLGHGHAWEIGLLVAVVLGFAIRPVLLGALLVPLRLTRGERLFVAFSGLKGAVPVLLGTYLLSEGVPDATRLYDVVVVVVAFSVVVQGGLVPTVARRLGVPMRVVEPEPWSLGLRFRDEPSGQRSYQVAAGSAADGSRIEDLPFGDDAWISFVSRNGALVQVRGETTLQSGDVVLVLVDVDDAAVIDEVFVAR
ncbi:MAG: cation:proton antiporter [Nocardioidaceae bacterium]